MSSSPAFTSSPRMPAISVAKRARIAGVSLAHSWSQSPSYITFQCGRPRVQSLHGCNNFPWGIVTAVKRLHPGAPDKKSASHPAKSISTSEPQAVSPASLTTELTSSQVSIEDLTPMMRHWMETKRRYPEYLILYRVGDFFEAFFEDSALFADSCDLVLTAKDAGKALRGRVPMAGIPHFTLDEKCRILLSKSINVAVVDQVEDSSAAAPGALVRRAVTRLITPGTLVDDALLDTTKSNYLAAVSVVSWRAAVLRFGVALVDVCTGEVRTTECEGFDALESCLCMAAPTELLIPAGSEGIPSDPAGMSNSVGGGSYSLAGQVGTPGSPKKSPKEATISSIASVARLAGVPVVTGRPADAFALDTATVLLCTRFAVDNIESLGLRQREGAVSALGAVVQFLSETAEVDGRGLVPLCYPVFFSPRDCLQLDEAALRNLEVLDTLRSGSSGKSLRWAVDRTVTAMGARRVRSWLRAPLKSVRDILYRQGIVATLVREEELCRALSRLLRSVADLERLAGRVGGQRASPRELQRLAHSLLLLPDIAGRLREAKLEDCDASRFDNILTAIDPPPRSREGGLEQAVDSLQDIGCLIRDALIDPSPSVLPTIATYSIGRAGKESRGLDASRVFRDGYCTELDALRASEADPTRWISIFEEEEQQRTGIASLRVRRLRNTGYAIRVARSVAERKIADDASFFASFGYERTLSTKAEIRFRSKSLSKYEREEHSVRAALVAREVELFYRLLERVGQQTSKIRAAAAGLAELDALAGFAVVSKEQGYVAPEIHDQPCRELCIKDGRHPVVEQNLPPGKTFVPNSFHLGTGSPALHIDGADRFVPPCDEMILCGPNASGKSCAMRLVGLLVILAQAGCFVPASFARLGISDRIFTRVGAVDDVSRGQSTFQVEMAETASILAQATPSSLVLLDEIGRGTAVADGIAIAWSVAEHMAGAQVGAIDGRDASCLGQHPCIPRTIFVTHYHELNELAALRNVEPFRMQTLRPASRSGADICCEDWVYTHRIVPGPSFESYGIAIARRAGFPVSVISRAEEVLAVLQEPAKNLAAHLRQSFALSGENVQSEFDSTSSIEHTDARPVSLEEFDDGFAKGLATGRAQGRKEAMDEAMSLIRNLRDAAD